MVMAGYEFMGDCPFSDVYFNSIVRDMHGRKMSKSLGNSPDPLEVIDTYGADALRFTIVSLAPVGQDVRYGVEKTEVGRNFANKIWNATRFALMNLGDQPIEPWTATIPAGRLDLPDRWILSCLAEASEQARASLDAYRFNDTASALYRFIWGEVCDWYLELIKPTLYGSDEKAKRAVRTTLMTVLDQTMRLLHPFMPFVTEEIWHALPMPRPAASIMVAAYPWSLAQWRDPEAETIVGQLIQTITVIRNIRAELGIPPTTSLAVRVAADGNGQKMKSLEHWIKTLARVGSVELLGDAPRPSGEPSGLVPGLGEVFVPLSGVVDPSAVRDRLERDLSKVEKEMKGVETKLARPDFIDKAPEDIVDKERQRAAHLRERRLVLERHLAALRAAQHSVISTPHLKK
jgi:valyl-tRNA synthetase